jgi:CheY-like chemotaxis protein
MSNAVKFTHTGGVTIGAASESGGISISITDTGIGIPHDQIDLIFDEFRQVDMGTARKYSGTGLGLAIADKYARMIGGKIQVRSTPGEGSTFTLFVPFMVDENQPDVFISQQPTEAGKARRNKAAESEAPSGRRILVVEDSEPVVIQLREMLNEEGYICDVARNGFEAIDMVENQIPDAVILDIMMPDLDGFGVLEQIRSREVTARLPVLILTAKYLEKEELKRLAQNNIYQYLRKGDVNMNELLSHIRSMFSEQNNKRNDPAAREHPDPGKPIIVVIDDNPDSVLTISSMLDKRVQVIRYSDVGAYLSGPEKIRPGLIFLDNILPGTDGIKGLQQIRNYLAPGHIPVVAFTAHAMKGDREKILHSGFDEYLPKPFDPADLQRLIKKWINL